MTNYYVAKGGNDADPGTESEPWLTIQKAADTLVAGDTVYIKNGTYNERVIPVNSGSSGSYIIYTAYPGNTPIIDGTGLSGGMNGLFHIDNKDYIKVSGLEAQNYGVNYGGSYGIYMINGCDHIITESNDVHNVGGCGIYVFNGGTNITIDNNEVSYTNLDPEWDQEMISLIGVDGFEVKNNYVHHSDNIAIDAKGGTGGSCSNGSIHHNHITNTDSGIYTDAWDDYEHDIDIYQNLIHDINYNALLAATEDGGTLKNIKFFNNLCYNGGGGFGFVMYSHAGPKENISIINNHFYNFNIRGIAIYPPNEDLTNIVIRNNICSQNTGGQILANQANVTVDHNLIDGTTETYGTDYVLSNPKFVNPSGADFHLQSDSPAINAGSSVNAPSDDYDGNIRPYDTNYDIGAYECSENVRVKLEDEELSDVRYLKLIEGIDEIAKASFTIPTRTLSGSEDIKIEVDRGNGYKRRFWGNITSHIETEYNEIEVEAESKEALFKGENVPYTEIAYTSKTGDWIVKQLVLDFLDWCDTSALAVLDTIAYVHFVEGNILDALTEIAEMCNKYWFWEPEDGKIRYVASGDLASGTTINTEYISEEDWIEDETKIKNMIHIKGGHVDGNPSNALVIKIAWDGESEQQYERREYTHACEEIINENTAQKLADGLLALHKDPIETGEAYDVPYDELLKVGRTVAISQTLHDGTYLIKTIEIDYEYETMSIQFSEMPWMLSHEIRDMQKELAILKRNAINTYESGKPILIKKEILKRGSSTSVTETFNSEMELPITLPGTIGGLSLISDSVHKRD